MMIGEWVYALCALSSIACALTFIKQYQRDRTRLLLFSCLCFAGLALNNVILWVDIVIMPESDLSGSLYRNIVGALSGIVLLYGLIWELT